MNVVYGAMKPRADDEPVIPADAERAPSSWWILPAILAGAVFWAALAWWAPAAAGVLLLACGVVIACAS